MATKSQNLLKKELQIAERLLSSHKYHSAIKKYKSCLIIDSSEPKIYKGKGLAYFHLGKFKEAEKEYKEALVLSPQDAQIYYSLGTVYYYLGLIDLAIVHFKKAIEMDNNLSPAYYSLGVAYESKGKTKEAITNIQKALTLSPQVKSLVLQPYIFQDKKDIFIDKEILSQILSQILSNIKKQIKKPFAIFSRKNTVSSKIKKTTTEKNYQDFINSGIEFCREGKLDKAVEEYKKAIILQPNISLGYDELGQAYYHLKKMNLAEEYFKKAIEVNPKYGTSYYHLGCIYYELGRLDEAAVQFKKAQECDNQDARAYYGLGVVYEAKGLAKEAFDMMEKAVSLSSNMKDLTPHIISYQQKSLPPMEERLMGKGGFFISLFRLLLLTLLAAPLYSLEFIFEHWEDRIEGTKLATILKRIEGGLASYLKRMEEA